MGGIETSIYVLTVLKKLDLFSSTASSASAGSSESFTPDELADVDASSISPLNRQLSPVVLVVPQTVPPF